MGAYLCRGMHPARLLCLLLALALLPSCRPQRQIPADNLVYVQVGDSITEGVANASGCSPGDFAIRRLATPTTFIKMGWPGESARDFLLLHRQQFLSCLRSIPPGHRVIAGVAYGPNDLNTTSRQRVLLHITRVVRWMRDTARVAEVLVVPVMNRLDARWGFTREADGVTKSRKFNEYRLWLNDRLRAELATTPGVRVAPEWCSPRMYGRNSPYDGKRFADLVHPLDLGARELGEGTIAHGIASFGGISLN